jgi:hypothetical protein
MNSHPRLHAAAAAAVVSEELELLVPRAAADMEQHHAAPLGAQEIEKTPSGRAAPLDMESEPAAARAAERIPPWREQITARGMVFALLLGFVFTVITMKLSLTTGLNTTMNVSAALLAFLTLRGWTRALERLGIASRPFTRQENTVVQTTIVACYTIAYGGRSPPTAVPLSERPTV